MSCENPQEKTKENLLEKTISADLLLSEQNLKSENSLCKSAKRNKYFPNSPQNNSIELNLEVKNIKINQNFNK